MELRELGLSTRTANALLRHANITTLERLRQRMAQDPVNVECTPQLGSKGFQEIQKFLKDMGAIIPGKPRSKPEDHPEENVCSMCAEPLKQEGWNNAGDILTCDNAQCSKYRQPQGWKPFSLGRWR